MHWKFEGRQIMRQCDMTKGINQKIIVRRNVNFTVCKGKGDPLNVHMGLKTSGAWHECV